MQTILARMVGNSTKISRTERLDLTLKDGDRVYFQIDSPATSDGSTPVLILFHGLGGCSESPYNLRIAQHAIEVGLRVARFSHRGTGPSGKITARNIYHAGSKEDIWQAITKIHQTFPNAPIAIVGFSLSGSMVLNLLGQDPTMIKTIPQLKFAAAVCPPIDLAASAKKLRQLQNKFYDSYFTRHLLDYAKQRAIQLNLPMPKFSKSYVTLELFDNEFTAPQAGFKDAADYYNRCSANQFMNRIDLPTLVIAAKDDPVVEFGAFQEGNFSSAIRLCRESSGGHMGFISAQKTKFGNFRWLDATITTWAVQNLLNH